MRRALAILAFSLAAGPALAHTGAAAQPAWSGPEPWMLVPMIAAAAIYALGFRRLRQRSGPGRGELVRRGRLFAAGIAVLAAATLSPLHALGARSFTAHMAEHELIMLAAAPLLVWSRPGGVMLWAFPPAGRQALAAIPRNAAAGGLWRVLTEPVLATVLQLAALWLWHLPSLFDLALKSEAWHAAQHLSFFASALLFWSAMLSPRRSPWTAAALLFATSMATGALGAFMALSESPWYGPYAALGLAAFGLAPTQDQQLAGVLMWVPGGLFHAVVAIALLVPALRSPPREAAHG
ncbi:MAG: cytochrome c oxidase assembly protein [Frankiales bacterium]|nr:cytochrome c oxidase assembly protein [Frankiales bacterium]